MVKAWLGRNIQRIIPFIVAITIAFTWFYYYQIGFSTFNKSNAISIYGSVIQGMSALLSVAIAVIIFRIQSLENRNQALEQSTLNYIFQITGIIYPQWIPAVEDDIRTEHLTERYYYSRLMIKQPHSPEYLKALKDDRVAQQTRLMQTLSLHENTSQTIRRMKNSLISSAIFLMAPIVLSLLMLMISDALDSFGNFFIISAVILASATGIALLIKIVLESTVEPNA